MSDEPYWLTTERLALRRFTHEDLDWFVELYSDADVTRYLGGTRDRRRAEALLNVRILQYYDEHPRLGIWMTVERVSGRRLGFHLLNHIQGETFIQVGFALGRSAWGRGFGTEMAFALLGYGFLTLSLPSIVAIANLENRASQHVLQKSGCTGTASARSRIPLTPRTGRWPGSSATRPSGWRNGARSGTRAG